MFLMNENYLKVVWNASKDEVIGDKRIYSWIPEHFEKVPSGEFGGDVNFDFENSCVAEVSEKIKFELLPKMRLI
jgi:hypothetical protein